ncbi:hypothetical protein D9M71_298370 [compost metagenome]
MIELERGKRRATTTAVLEESQFAGGEITRRQCLQQTRQMIGVFRHFHHGAVTGSKNAGQRVKCHGDREVPGHDNPDHTDWLRDKAGPRQRQLHRINVALLRLHPLLHPLDGVLQAIQGDCDFGEGRFKARTATVILVDRLDERFTVIGDQPHQRLEVSHALHSVRVAVALKVGLLTFQALKKLDWDFDFSVHRCVTRCVCRDAACP